MESFTDSGQLSIQSRADSGRCRCCRKVIRLLFSSLGFAVGFGSFLIQMLSLNAVLADRISHWMWLYLLVEIPLALHMAANFRTGSAVQSGNLQWIVYCWLLCTKTGICYFQVMPELTYEDMRMLVSSMCLTPVLYLVLTTRALLQLFDQSKKWEGNAGSKRERREHVTLDVILLQDMVWHVVIDLIDMLNIMFLARPADSRDGIGEALVTEFPRMITNISRAAGVFACLGFLFHQQSFPQANYVATRYFGTISANRKEAAQTDLVRSDSTTSFKSQSFYSYRHSSSNVVSGVLLPDMLGRSDNALGMMESAVAQTQQDPSLLEIRIDVVKARKRSAIVSILLIDLPFFIIRSYLYSLTLSVDASSAQTDINQILVTAAIGANSTLFTKVEKRPQLDKWWVKNGLCLLLQAMQLRFVQQADLEQSQNLQWRDAHQFQEHSKVYSRVARRRRRQRDPQWQSLKHAWEDMDRNQPEFETADIAVGSSDDSPSDECFHTSIASGDHHATAPPVPSTANNQISGTAEAQTLGAPSSQSKQQVHLWQRLTKCLCFYACCCRRRRCGCCPHAIVLHSLMGLVVGWLIAKQDFAQAQTTLLIAMGKDASSVEGSSER